MNSMQVWRRCGATALAILTLAACAKPVTAAEPATFQIHIKPVTGSKPQADALEVRWTLDLPAGSDFDLTAPITYAGVEGVADRIESLSARDGSGPITFTIRDDPPHPGGFPHFRHWTAERPVSGEVEVAYVARARSPGGRGGPPFDLRASGGGLSGAGSGFLLLPRGAATSRSHLSWDLADLPGGSGARTTFGDGDVQIDGPPSRLMQGWYMAGPFGHYEGAGDSAGFNAAWLGRAPFDAAAEMAWAADAYAYLGEAFGYLDPVPPYRVFMRFVDGAPCGGGTALGASFMYARCALAEGETAPSPRETLIHEMVHMWVGGIEGPQGVTSWFTEGLTTHYTRLMMLRGGLDSVDAYGAHINNSAQALYGLAAQDMTAQEIVAVGFADGDIRHIPYHRGAFYFADLDARIREQSGGTRTLDTVLRPMFEGRQAGEIFDHAAWITLVSAEIGPAAQAEFEARILRGEAFAPHPNAFGPCFARRDKTYEIEGRGPVDRYEWVRLTDVPDDLCRNW
ncbi:hypothetical protein [Phenylobacterium sp.]|uniref:hypothetical protein n=1 Tax=Phenylobacterium sp. TaxID=1871053 RepID=UPI00272F46B4|nr:hypothetical protein [Phenylobacterium sp.]MDP2213435.1 hypothetical protein [Phenylobacterium sp.]